MEYRRLGTSGLQVSQLSFGSWITFGNQIEDDSRLKRDEFSSISERIFTSENANKVLKLRSIAQELSISLPVLGVAWCLKNPNVSTAILGATKVAQIQDNLKAGEALHLLTDEIMIRIEGAPNNRPSHPKF